MINRCELPLSSLVHRFGLWLAHAIKSSCCMVKVRDVRWVQWIHPLEGSVKVNVDGSSFG